MEEVTAVYISEDSTKLAYVLDHGDGGIYVVDTEEEAPRQVHELGDAWVLLQGGPLS